jgi:hypothetical protein
MAWLPADFSYPTRIPVCDGYHLRPVTAADADLDYPAVMGSQPDDQATTDKKAFAALWAAIADEYGLPSYQYNQI